MLAAWLRLKYPDTFAGAIAASAPIRAFEGMDPAFDSNTYWQVVTRDASSAGGATDQCSTNIRNAWPLIFNLSSTSSGRGTLSSTFKLCSPLKTSEDGWSLAMYLLMAFDTMAMGLFGAEDKITDFNI